MSREVVRDAFMGRLAEDPRHYAFLVGETAAASMLVLLQGDGEQIGENWHYIRETRGVDNRIESIVDAQSDATKPATNEALNDELTALKEWRESLVSQRPDDYGYTALVGQSFEVGAKGLLLAVITNVVVRGARGIWAERDERKAKREAKREATTRVRAQKQEGDTTSSHHVAASRH